MLISQENTRSFLPPRVVLEKIRSKSKILLNHHSFAFFFEDAYHPTLSFLISLWFAMNVYSVLQGTPLDCTATIMDGSVL